MMKPAAFGFNLALALGSFAAVPAFAEEHEGGASLPQLDASTYSGQLFWLAVSFVALYAVMSRLALPGVGETLERRKTQKDGDLNQAAAWNDEAADIRTAYEKSLSDAQKKAAMTAAAAERDMSAKISAEQAKFAESARRRLAEAELRISQAKAGAMKSLSGVAAEIAAEMAEKIANVDVTEADAAKAVGSVMKEG